MLRKVRLQVGVNPMPLTFLASFLTTRLLMPTLPAPFSKGYKARPRP